MNARKLLTNLPAMTLLLAAGLLLPACGGGTDAPHADNGADTDAQPQPAGGGTAEELAFRPAVHKAPPGTSPVFALSHDYPQQLPGSCPDTQSQTWLNIDVDFTDTTPTWDGPWADYMDAILGYVRTGQDPDLKDEIGWQVAVDGETRWYHVPWMAFDEASGREYYHGLTNELSVHQSMFEGPGRGTGTHELPLAGQGTGPLFETWAFGVYNECGGYSIGQVFPADGKPSMVEQDGRTLPAGLPFSEGSIVTKLLFSTATPEQVPYLSGSAKWQANRHVPEGDENYDRCQRETGDVHFVQMDVAVVDERSPTRWVFGTFVYNSTLQGETFWDHLSPVGIQWGSDPGTFPAVPEAESQLAWQSVLAPIDIYEHYGCNGRLAGPVDEAESACLTCHMGAYTADVGGVPEQGKNIPAIFEFDGICYEYNQENVNYFSNYAYPDPYPGGKYPEAIPLDSSLQLQVAFTEYGQWNTTGKSGSCTG